MKKTQILDCLKNKTYVRIKPSKHGVGVFAVRKIPKGIEPLAEYPEIKWVGFKKEELRDLPQGVMKMIEDFCPFEKEKYWIPADGMKRVYNSYYLNHSKNPNMSASKDSENFTTLREIEEGEELTVDYDTYDKTNHQF